MKDFIKNLSSWIHFGVNMETKIEAKASEQGADEALKSLYASLGSGVKILLTCMGIALILWAVCSLK